MFGMLGKKTAGRFPVNNYNLLKIIDDEMVTK